MEFIKTWTVCVCITLIVSVIFMTLSPKGTMGKFYRIIISVFIFLSFIYPLTNFKLDTFKNDFKFKDSYSAVAENAVDIEIANKIISVLEENNVDFSMVDVETRINGDEITIEEVKISVIDDYDVKEVEKIVLDNLGIIANVKRIGE